MAGIKKFGTFAGVFTPSILTILGVIMYLRLPTIVGQAGLWTSLGIILIAHIISVTTGLSVSSIATDKKVQAGGTYFMISRSLGLPIGGTLGLALFVGLSFSVSLYIIGFSESFLQYFGWPADTNAIRIAGTIALIVVTTVTIISTSLALRMQFVIMAAIVLSLISILFGSHDFAPVAPKFTSSEGVSFMLLFGIFFPAVTGFEAGVSMSGDLRDPKKSIPKGTIWAVVVGLAAYIGLIFFFVYTVDASLLATDNQALLTIALVPELVVAGIWGATISSALGSILGAPRILQATAVDNITPNLFAKGAGKGNEPRNALILTFIIAEGGILIGELDVIARIVSIFFITTYGFLNLSAAFESWTSADFRPDFRVPIWVSILGALACFIVMIQLDFLAMIGATLILGLLYLYLKRKELALESGDTWSGIWASLVKSGLEYLSTEKIHRRNWRPNLLMFSGSETERPHLVELGQAIAGRLGILTSFEIISAKEESFLKETEKVESDHGIYYSRQYRTPDVYDGMEQIARIYGFAGVAPNTILMGWSKTEKNQEKFAHLIANLRKADYNTVFLNYDSEQKYGNHRTIDIWWRGSGRSLTFAISLIRHLVADGLWKTAQPRLLLILDDLSQMDRVRRTLQQLMDDYRMPMSLKLIDNSLEALPAPTIIARESAAADLTILGLSDRSEQQAVKTVKEVRNLLDTLGTTLLIAASSNFEAFDLQVNRKRTLDEESELLENEHALPELPSVYNEWLAEDLQKIDERNRKVLLAFYQQSFVPYFRENRLIIQSLESTAKGVLNTLAKEWEQYEDTFRRRKSLQKAVNELHFQTRTLLGDIPEDYLKDQKESFDKGIAWYFKQLEVDVMRFPREIKTNIPREKLRVTAGNTLAMRWLKFRLRAAAWVTRQEPHHRVRYQQIASYYLRDNRYVFLAALLREWQQQSLHFFHEVQLVVKEVEQQLKTWASQVETLEAEAFSYETLSSRMAIEQLDSNQNTLQQLWLKRIQIEYRRNLSLLAQSVESITGLAQLKKTRNTARFYETTASQISNFPEQWYENSQLEVNTITLDLFLQIIKTRVRQEVVEYQEQMGQLLTRNYLKPLEQLEEQLKSSDEVEVDYGQSDEAVLQKNLAEYYEGINELVEEIPESITINYNYVDEQEIISVPVQQLAEYWTETTFYLPLQSKIIETDQQLLRSQAAVRDMVRLVNLQTEGRGDADKQVWQDTTLLVENEKKKIEAILSALHDDIKSHLQESFENLSIDAFIVQSGDLSSITRSYQSQLVKNKVEQYQGRLRQFIRGIGTRLLYSRSQGILLAKRLTKTETDLQSPTANVLNFVEQVTPSSDIVRHLPLYYQNLFGGRSEISDDFWIERPQEMELAERAIERLRQGYAGGILLLGERDSGKTALSQRIGKRFSRKEDRIIQVFPTRAGSIRISDFNKELQRATRKAGTPDQIIKNLPAGSTIVINDLEMWWERSAKGFEVVNEIMRLIAKYSPQILFVVNTNPFAYQLINLVNPIADYFLNIIPYQPFGTEEIEQLILLRHWSGGLTFVLNERGEETLSEWQKVQFFNAFFDYSGGNPGAALGAWLASIERKVDKAVHLSVPRTPDYDGLRNMPTDWTILLVQFLLHKRLSLPRMRRVLHLDTASLTDILQDLIRAGLVVEKESGVYQLNVYTEVHLINLLKEQGIL
ncbi:amino acid permease [Tunicatimonas pelagia]|uniref:amino acid permease n=1 Tax=Tunicatimonas pelagia TaxID=931531 RepID=UPI002666B1F3|nr:amino acid permease [Tunicatimonas pelagia]WKN43112.1 amino acid permease [Tunicatimonas pelagia]